MAGASPRGEGPCRLIRYVIDSSAVWRILRDEQLRASWSEVVSVGAVGSCQPQRIEFRRSARDLGDHDDMSRMFDDLYPDVPVHKSAWRWIETAQYRLCRRGQHRALSVVDLLICAVAAHHGLTVLHDDTDFVAAARHLADISERRVDDEPSDFL